MTTYEKWSLILTALGHLLVAASIIYAARQWIVSKRSFDREIVKDTRGYISEINAQMHNLQKDIIGLDIDPYNLDHRSDDAKPVRQLLNTIEAAAYELESEFYNREMLRNHVAMQAVSVWSRWKPFVDVVRNETGRPQIWQETEKLAATRKN